MVHSQLQGETMERSAEELSRLFSQVYPMEASTLDILLQQFLMGYYMPSIGWQLLLCGKPNTLKQAIKDATDIEYALSFKSSHE